MDYFFQEFKDTDKLVELSEDESKHIYKVLRKREGEAIGLLNGEGLELHGKIVSYSGKKITVQTEKVLHHPKTKSQNLTIAIAPTKNIDRFEYFLEKCTEIGIGEIVPLLCSNSERKIIKKEKLDRRIVAAMKQSKHFYLPRLRELTEFNEFIKNSDSEMKFIAHCEDFETKLNFNNLKDSTKKTTILIGPEGDFSINEIRFALENGFQAVNLGESRLRTETAGVYSCVCFNL